MWWIAIHQGIKFGKTRRDLHVISGNVWGVCSDMHAPVPFCGNSGVYMGALIQKLLGRDILSFPQRFWTESEDGDDGSGRWNEGRAANDYILLLMPSSKKARRLDLFVIFVLALAIYALASQ
jgi:hypothetical protein